MLERVGLVAERVRGMLAELGFATAVVDASALFHELMEELEFGLFVVGVERPEELGELRLTRCEPLVLLAPPPSDGGWGSFRVLLPHAHCVDRSLTPPDALRHVLRAPERRVETPADLVRETFGVFGLSERQLEVLRAALLGASSEEIARRLFISELTVRNHLHAIYERVGVSGRRELLGRFVRGLVGSPPPQRSLRYEISS